MMRLAGGRKSSERIRKKYSFSRFKNTPDNPLDEEGNEIFGKVGDAGSMDKGVSKMKSKKMKHASGEDTDFVGHPQLRVSSASTISKADELKAINITNNVAKEVRKMSLTDAMKIRIEERELDPKGVRPKDTKVDEKREEDGLGVKTRMHPTKSGLRSGNKSGEPFVVPTVTDEMRSRLHPTWNGDEMNEEKNMDERVNKDRPVNKKRSRNVPRTSEEGDGIVKDGVANRDERNEERPVNDGVLRTRTSPRVLHETIQALTQGQRKDVESVGLGWLLEMKTDGIPSRLGYYVVDRLDTDNMTLRLRDGVLQITLQSIHDMLGVPLGGIDLLNEEPAPRDVDITAMFNRQFDKPKCRPNDIKTLIIKSGSVGYWFKVNFVVLVANVLGECSGQGKCHTQIISRFKSDEMLREIDWCQFIFDMLKRSKDKWTSDSSVCFYAGPITYLTLLYVHATESKNYTVQRLRPATLSWSFEDLKKREASEIQEGGLGSAVLTPLPTDVPSSSRTFQENHNSNKQRNEGSADNERMDDIGRMENTIAIVTSTKVEAEMQLEKLLSKYPDDAEVLHFIDIMRDIYRYDIRYEKSSGGEDGENVSTFTEQERDESAGAIVLSQKPDDPLSQIWFTPTLHRMCDDAYENSESNKKDRKEFIVVAQPDFDNEDSPMEVMNQISVIKTTRKDKGKGVMIEDEWPLKKCKSKDTSNDSEDNVDGRAPVLARRRSVRLGDHLRSPYVRRAVDMKVASEDRRVHEWAITGLGVDHETMVLFDNGANMNRRALQGLASKTCIPTQVVDVWAELLNYEEKFRSRDSLRRYFFTTVVMGHPNLQSTFMDFNAQFEMFSANLSRSAHFNAEVLRFRTLDLVFFPIFDCGNYYLVVYNLKKPSMVILDHRFWSGGEIDDTMGMYDNVVQILNNLFVKHLRTVNHRSADTFEKVEHRRHEMVWQTRTVHDDGGVFLMRHMETWMGDERSWKTGFTKEGPSQKIQLTDLRKKYTAKLALSPINKKRADIMKEVDDFHKMDPTLVAQLIKEATERQALRLLF